MTLADFSRALTPEISPSKVLYLSPPLALSAAHDGPQLALVRFDLDGLSVVRRELL